MKFILYLFFCFGFFIATAQNPLYIPPVLNGPVFNLSVQSGTKIFYVTIATPTYGINGNWMAPTLIVNKGDSITLNVKNNLSTRTTMHWHGLHVAPKNDGGPHQVILPAATWSPSFKIRNYAATFWYHPHGTGQTDLQVSKGIAGMIIVKDSAEALLNLPRNYGVDDVPLIIQSKAFDELQQIAVATEMDTAMFVNGTLYPYFNAPQQVVRFRLLNGSSMRTYNIGFSNQQLFYKIATDGGLLDTPQTINRLRLAPGERAEILVDFSGMLNQNIYLKSFSSQLTKGIYGADSVGNAINFIPDYRNNFLNGSDFNLLQLHIIATTPNAVLTVPDHLIPYLPFNPVSSSHNRIIVFDTLRALPADVPDLAEGPFGINNKSFDMDVLNEVVQINTTEVWTLVNRTLVAHPFHIHDVQFNLIERGGIKPPAYDKGWKDVVLVMSNDSVKFITRFESFSDPIVPYMYHCHMLHHEDDGMMGSFLVVDSLSNALFEPELNEFTLYPNPTGNAVFLAFKDELKNVEIDVINITGEIVLKQSFDNAGTIKINLADIGSGIYFIHVKPMHNTNTLYRTQKILKL